MRKLRFEITPQFLVSANQPYLIGFGGGANLQMHITDWFGIGGSFHYTANVAAPFVGRILEALPDKYAGAGDPAAGLRQPSKQIFQDHLVGPSMLGALYATLTPIGGKFALFNTLFANYDFYGLAGAGVAILDTPLTSGATSYMDTAGMTRMVKTGDPSPTANDVNLQSPEVFRGPRFAGVLGIGAHIFFNHWIGLQFELRDYIYKSNPGGGDVSTSDNNMDNSPTLSSADEYIVSNLYFGVGLTLMLPPKAKISR